MTDGDRRSQLRQGLVIDGHVAVEVASDFESANTRGAAQRIGANTASACTVISDERMGRGREVRGDLHLRAALAIYRGDTAGDPLFPPATHLRHRLYPRRSLGHDPTLTDRPADW